MSGHFGVKEEERGSLDAIDEYFRVRVRVRVTRRETKKKKKKKLCEGGSHRWLSSIGL